MVEELRDEYIGEHTNRSSVEYCQKLGLEINPRDLILDVGASAGRFAREVEAKYSSLGTKVVSLDRFSEDDVIQGKIQFSSDDGEQVEFYNSNRVVGDIRYIGENDLPENTYDKIVSFYAFPTWSETSEDTWRSLVNITRTCKQGGEIRLFPIWKVPKSKKYSGFNSNIHFEATKKVLKSCGYEVIVEKDSEIPDAYRLVIKKKGVVVPTLEEFEWESKSNLNKFVARLFSRK